MLRKLVAVSIPIGMLNTVHAKESGTWILGVVCQTSRHSFEEVDGFFERLEGIFEKEYFTKAQVVKAIKEFIPNFDYEEKGRFGLYRQ